MTLEYSKKTYLLWALIMLPLVYMCVIIPGQTYALGFEQLDISPFTLLITCGLLTTILSTGFYLLLRAAPHGLQFFVVCILTLLALLTFYNFNFLDYEDKIIGANSDVFDGAYGMLEYLGFGICAVMVGALAFKWTKHLQTGLLIFVFATGVPMLLGLFSYQAGDTQTVSADDTMPPLLFSYSPEKNIVHVILDGMEGHIFSNFLTNDSNLRNRFSGFEFFPDTLASSDITFLSIGSIVSGRAFDGEGLILNYQLPIGLQKAEFGTPENVAPLFKRVDAAGYDIDIIAGPGGAMKTRKLYRSYIETDKFDSNLSFNHAGKLFDLSLVKAMPWSIKRSIYQNGQWKFSKLKSQNNENLPRANRAMSFMKGYEQKIRTRNDRPSYKWIHLISPHGPYTTGETCGVIVTDPRIATGPKKGGDLPLQNVINQSRCQILSLLDFLDGLQSKGVYDSATIIVHGDHGICSRRGSDMEKDTKRLPHCFGNTQPLLLVKGAGTEGPIKVNTAFMSLKNIDSIIGAALDGKLGESFYRQVHRSNARRVFYDFKPNRVVAAKQGYFEQVTKYEVAGPMAEPSSWSKISKDIIIEEKELELGEIITVERAGRNDKGIWVIHTGGNLNRMYVDAKGERMRISTKESSFSIPLPIDRSVNEFYLIDPEKGLKQLLPIPN